jgi:hypothetical protein
MTPARATLSWIVQVIVDGFNDSARRVDALLCALHLGARPVPAFVIERPAASRRMRARSRRAVRRSSGVGTSCA